MGQCMFASLLHDRWRHYHHGRMSIHMPTSPYTRPMIFSLCTCLCTNSNSILDCRLCRSSFSHFLIYFCFVHPEHVSMYLPMCRPTIWLRIYTRVCKRPTYPHVHTCLHTCQYPSPSQCLPAHLHTCLDTCLHICCHTFQQQVAQLAG